MNHTTQRKQAIANQFLDLEALVDGDEDVDEDEENQSDIIDDDFTEDVGVEQYNQSWKRLADVDENPNVLGDLVADLEKRYAKTSTPRAAEASLSRPLQIDSTMGSILNGIVHLPRNNDTPLWRVRCRPGSEEDIVFFLFQKVVPSHELRAAFMRPSIRGWVYLEAKLNENLHQLLRLTPGILLRHTDIIIQHIEFKDWKALLTMHGFKETPKVGDWVGVRKGIYKGDVGYVNAVDGLGIQLLLIPRLPPPQPSGTPSKRKRPSPPISALFRPASIKEAYGIEPTHVTGDLYSFQGNYFDHGLIVKAFDFSSVSRVHQMPLYLVCHFWESRHPKLMASPAFPRPLEWEFSEGDKVIVGSPGKPGIITSILSDSAEVELSNNDGIVVTSWLQIRKVIPGGAFVEVSGGKYRGRKGWVDGMGECDGALVIELKDIETENPSLDRITIFEAHVNLLKQVDPPFVLAKPPTDLQKAQFHRVPWFRTEIMIVGRHPLKARRGIVLDILCNQATPSGLRVCVELTTLNTASPFRHVVLDYDYVVEVMGGQKLFAYAPTNDELFIPRNYTLRTSQPIRPLPQDLSAYINVVLPNATPGNATPMPENPDSSSSPAWNPSHVLPPDNPPTRRPIHETKHVLLDSRLLDAPLRVVVTGGTYKEKDMTVSIQSTNEKLVIRWKSYNSWIPLDPEWVTPKYPNAKHDNGLMIVISGDHCGKYVRRIYHRYEGEKLTVILGVVKRVAGQADTLLEERLDLEVSSLCLCMESKEDKILNKSLMDAVRTEARKIRAK